MYKVKIGKEEVMLDPANLEVDESNLNDFLCKFSSVYAYYSAKWAECQSLQYQADDYHEEVYCKAFKVYKDGASDKLAEARAKATVEVVEARKEARFAKLNAQLLYGYLRALDKCFECAINLGYNIRKEMDKIFPKDIKKSPLNVEHELDKIFSED